MKKRPASLRGSITLLFFTIMVVTFFLIAVAILLGARMHFIKDRVNPFFAAIVIAIFVCILGSRITAISLKSALRPIKNISQAAGAEGAHKGGGPHWGAADDAPACSS